MHRAGADGFAQTVVGVVIVFREDALPAFDQARRHGLRADVHQPPLVELVIFQLDLAAVDGVQNVLRPWDQQPDDRALFFGDRADDPFGFDALEQDRLAADQETAEPVHLGAGMIKRRDAQEIIFAGLPVMLLFHRAGVHQTLVRMDDRLRETSRAGGEIDRRQFVVGQRDLRRAARTVGDQIVVGFGKRRAVFADIQQGLHFRQPVADRLDAAGEFRAEQERVHVGQVEAVADLFRGVTEIERDRHRAAFQNAEINRQPFQTVHQQDADPLSFGDPAGEQEIGQTVCFGVEFAPGHFRTEGIVPARFDQRVFPPRRVTFFQFLRIDLDQCNIIAVKFGILFQNGGNRHFLFLSCRLYMLIYSKNIT